LQNEKYAFYSIMFSLTFELSLFFSRSKKKKLCQNQTHQKRLF